MQTSSSSPTPEPAFPEHERPASSVPATATPLMQWSTRALFLLAGIGTAAWASLVADTKLRTGLDEAQLGLVLLSLGIGSILGMPASGVLAARFGYRRILIVCGAILCAILPILALVDSVITLGMALFVFGASIGIFDCVMNMQAIIVERDSGRALMSGFHGCYSLGGIVGAFMTSAIMMAGLSPFNAVLITMLVVFGLLLFGASNALRGGREGGEADSGPAFALPHGVVLFLGILCFTVFLTEGSMLDWSAVLLTETHGLTPAQAGMGYACFSITMTLGRLMGDRIVDRIGRQRIVIIGGLLAAAGIALGTLVPAWLAAMLGFALVGLGCSNIVPVLFTAVGRQTVMPQKVAVPAMSTMGYAGVLAGPAAIGFIAHQTSLPAALLLVAMMMLGVAISGRFLKV